MMSDGIFLIQKLWIDSMENDSSHAMGYGNVGFVYTKEEADEIVAAGGKYIGTGWPVDKGVSVDYYRALSVEKFTEVKNGQINDETTQENSKE
jgi:hypothetical protein